MYIRSLILIVLMAISSIAIAQDIYEVSTGSISFNSKAPQELINASSPQLKGVVDARKKTFVFKINVASFQGFNSPLQQEHFNENYMETNKFPEASYAGKIIEDVNLLVDGTYDVRVKGKLKIHGLEQERIINSRIVVKNGKISIASDFIVSLADYSIKIPRVVYDKLAPDINVTIAATLLPKH
ncbi:MAG: YceI family protein [Sphingobacteriales bacterium]|nr:MAG: YceI family protein [Sphingobacteriales bacterium]